MANTSGIAYALVPGNRIWLPRCMVTNRSEYILKNTIDIDIKLYINSVSVITFTCQIKQHIWYIFSVGISIEESMSLKNTGLFIYPDGTVMGTVISNLQTRCTVNLRKFPFDNQTCSVHISVNTWRRYTALIPFTMDSMDVTDDLYEENTEWQNVKYEQHVKSYFFNESGLTGSFDVIVLVISMERNPTFYILYLLIPSVLMAFVSVLVFLLPPQSGERVSLSITVLLSYTVFLMTVSDMTPRGGSNTSLLGTYILHIIQHYQYLKIY